VRLPEMEVTYVSASSKTTWKGYVVRTEGMIVNNTDVLWLVAELKGDQLNSIENNAVIDIGQFVDAEIDGRSLENIIVLPREALLQGNTVMVVENGDTLRTRNVIVMEANPEMVVITEGISVGEQINITQLGSTAEGMLVTPILEEGAM
jgi:multidrug efflux pump subunit AcrA (membrane-fusion protein)